MPETIAPSPSPVAPSTAAPHATPAGLCRQIELTLPREPNDRVKCTHIAGSRFRCNWWTIESSNAKDKREAPAPWAVTASQRIRKSLFLSATVGPTGKLQIEEIPAPAPRA